MNRKGHETEPEAQRKEFANPCTHLVATVQARKYCLPTAYETPLTATVRGGGSDMVGIMFAAAGPLGMPRALRFPPVLTPTEKQPQV